MTTHRTAPRPTPRLGDDHPSWLQDIDATLPVTASYIVHGNIHDRHLVPTPSGPAPMDVTSALWTTLQASGFEALIVHSPLGHRVYPPSAVDTAAAAVGLTAADLGATAGPERLGNMIAAVLREPAHRVALAIDYVSQRQAHGQVSGGEHDMLAATLALLDDARPLMIGEARRAPVYNALFWLVEQPADLPPWFVGGSDVIRQISLPHPDLTARANLARALMGPPGTLLGPDDEAAAIRFAESTEGLTLKPESTGLVAVR